MINRAYLDWRFVLAWCCALSGSTPAAAAAFAKLASGSVHAAVNPFEGLSLTMLLGCACVALIGGLANTTVAIHAATVKRRPIALRTMLLRDVVVSVAVGILGYAVGAASGKGGPTLLGMLIVFGFYGARLFELAARRFGIDPSQPSPPSSTFGDTIPQHKDSP